MSSLLYANVDCFLRNNIICQIDEYKINSNGYLILSNDKYIPLNSYIWLFKTIDKYEIKDELFSDENISYDKKLFIEKF